MFSNYLIQGVTALSDGVVGAALSINLFQLLPDNQLAQALQSTFNQFYWVGNELWKQGHLFSNPGPLLSALMIWLEGTLLIGIGASEILLAKMMLAILFVIAPLVGIFSLFSRLKGVLDAWLGLLISFIFVQILVTAVLMIALSLAYQMMLSDMVQQAIQGVGGLGVGWPLLVISLLCFFMMTRVHALSMALGRVSAGQSFSGGIQTLMHYVMQSIKLTQKTVRSTTSSMGVLVNQIKR